MRDRAADERLVLAWHERAFRYALFLCGDPDRAADLAQDALVRALVRRPADLPDEAFGSWLRTVTLRLHIDRLRRLRRELRALRAWLPLAGERPAPEVRPELLEALERLSPRQRACVVLRYLDDLPEEEVAATLGLRVGTVKAHLARARETLRAALAPAAPSKAP